MIRIQKQEAEKRWGELSPTLREALFSEENSSVVLQVSGAKKLNEKQIEWLLVTTGDVIMGFIPLDPVKIAEEISERTGIDKQTAYEISQELSRKIFDKLKSEIENIGIGASVIYNNSSINSDQTQSIPKTTNEFRNMMNDNQNKIQPEPGIQRGQAMQNLESRLSGYNQESRPREFLNELTNDRNKRFEQSTFNNRGGFSNNAKTEETHEAPFIIHEEKPVFSKEQTGFKKEESNSPMSYQPFKIQDVKPQKEAPISAKIDFGEEKPRKASPWDDKDKDDNIRVVHYSDFKSMPKKQS